MLEINAVTGVVPKGNCRDAAPSALFIEQIKYSYNNFRPLVKVTTTTAVASEDIIKNIKENYKLDLPWFHHLEGFKQFKGVSQIALVGGGPSLKDHLDELKSFETIIACGSVHDYLIDNGIIPSFACACDPDPVVSNYYTKSRQEVTYLLATNCHPSVFDKLKKYRVYRWNCHSDQHEEVFKELDPEFEAIGGGCTIGLRAISIAIVLGYNNIHFFGFDSCMENNKHHAYSFIEEAEKETLKDTYELRLGLNEDEPDKKIYKLAGYQLAQAHHFKQYYEAYGNYFTPTFHGEGLLPDMWKMMVKDYENRTGVKL